MKLKNCLVGCALLFMTILIACSAGQTIGGKEKSEIIDKIKILETSEYALYNFKIDYDAYLAQVDGIVSDAYLKAVSDQVIFGYDGAKYTSKELLGMTQEEWSKHKDYMLGLIKGIGVNEQESTIQISEPYNSEQENEVFIYTSQIKEVKDKPFTKTNKKYTLNLLDSQWLITNVESDHFTYGSEKSEEEIQSKLTEMNYQKHENLPIEYNEDSLILQGVAED